MTVIMPLDKLTPDDPRVERKEVEVNGRKYSYLIAQPEGTPKGHILLIHGFPDMAFGWRYQIPFFQSLGYVVVAPDLLGYGRTVSPAADDHAWGLKPMADDIAALSAAVFGEDVKIILGGHDWGGALIWRVAIWHPEILLGVFSVCTPYNAPMPVYVDLETLVSSGKLASFKYQLQFISGEVEEHIKTPEDIRRFMLALFGARTEDTREVAFTVENGIIFDRLPRLAPSTPLVSPEEMDEYVRLYSEGSGIAGPLQWYRMRKAVFDEEKPLADKGPFKLAMPSLFVQASKDIALPPSMAKRMAENFEDLDTKTVEASHWALWHAPDKVNAAVRDWIAEKFEGAGKSSL